MDILIKNYQMPKEGVFNLLIYPEGDVFYVNPYNEAVCSTNAKAIELPPHGDLIDRQESIRRFDNLSEVYDIALKDCDLEKEVYPHFEALMRGKKAVIKLAGKMLSECPTVLEASNE